MSDAAPLPRCDGRASRDKFSGVVEMDETFIGGVKSGKRGRGAAGKVLVAGAIERAPQDRRGFGRARLAIVASAKSDALREFDTANIIPGSIVISDALSSYPNALAGPDYEHDPINIKRFGVAGPSTAARRTPAVQPVQAVAGGHPPGCGRVHLLVQPAYRTPTRPAVPPAPGAGS